MYMKVISLDQESDHSLLQRWMYGITGTPSAAKGSGLVLKASKSCMHLQKWPLSVPVNTLSYLIGRIRA